MEHRLTPPLLFGGDYNPEQWPEETWEEDMRRLKAANINSLTINVFSWALLQPTEYTYDFSWLDRLITLAKRYEMKLVLATATAALPAWLVRKYPDVSRTNSDGVEALHGKRANACPNSPHYQHFAIELVERLAKRYANESAVICWHVGNEFTGQCYCPRCIAAFRSWLQKHYQTLDAVNQAWNSAFWGHTYHQWEEIQPPTHRSDVIQAPGDKPVLEGAALDYRRFQSESICNNYKQERDCIRKYDVDTPITTNLMGTQKDLDYFQWAKSLDIVSWDSYPTTTTPPSQTAMEHDLMRGLKHAPFMLMEQAVSQQNWQDYCKLKRPHEMRMLSYQAIAHGARTIQYFQMKQSRGGIEKYHSAVISHVDAGNSTPTRSYREVQALGKELESLPEELFTSQQSSSIAILFDWPSYWAMEYATGPRLDSDYVDQVRTYYKAFYDAGLNVEMISRDDDLTPYRIVITPVLNCMSEALATRITEFVAKGGTLLATYLSGISDEHAQIYLGGYPGALRKVLGMYSEEFEALKPAEHTTLRFSNGTTAQSGYLCDVIHLNTATAVASFDDSERFYDGSPAITRNQYQNGNAFYVGTQPDADGLRLLLKQVLDAAGMNLPAHTQNVEISTRKSSSHRYTFVINTANEATTASLPVSGYDLLSQKSISDTLQLAPFGVAIIESSCE